MDNCLTSWSTKCALPKSKPSHNSVVVTVRTSDCSLVEELHLVLSDHVDKIIINIQRSQQLITESTTEKYDPMSSIFEVTDGCGGHYCSGKYLGWLCEATAF